MAVPVGVLIGTSRFWEAALEPLADFIRYMPVVAFLPLTILWAGTTDLQKFLIIWIGTFFQQVLMVMDNVKRVPSDFIGLGRTLGLSELKLQMKIVIPSALPGIWDTLRITFGWAWTWLVVAASFAGYLLVLVGARTRAAGTFYRPVRGVFPPAAGLAAAAGWISAASYLSLGGALALSAPGGAVYLVGWTAGFALLALLVTPYLRRSGRHTIPQLLAERFRSPAAGAAAAACVLLVTFTYLSAQLRGAAIVLSRFVPMPLPGAVALGTAVVLGYTALGRLRTLTGGQVAQYLVLAAAFFALAGGLALELSGSFLPQGVFWARLSPEGAALLGQPAGSRLPEAVDRLAGALGWPPYAASLRGPADLVASTLALVAGTAALPHMVSRFLAMPRAADARRSAGWALAFIVLFYSAVPAVALAARAGLLATLSRPGPASAWVEAWAPSGLLAAPGGAAPSIDPDVLVLAAPEMLRLPPWLVAVAAAGALAAAVSAAAALVASLGAAAARDLVKAFLLPRLSERAELATARASAAVLTGAAALLALRPPGTVVETVALAFGLAGAALFPALLAGALWRRATGQGVLWGTLSGAG
jgi:cation/acetate symporter